MSGLVGYGSSDEEEPVAAGNPPFMTAEHGVNQPLALSHGTSHEPSADPLTIEYTAPQCDAPNATLVGPLGPPKSASSVDATEPAPQSPYSVYRTSVWDLTLPQVPNLNIPPSPPGSPPPGIEKKFEHFLELKRRGVHFNAKLSKSSALKNPSLLQKLMASAGVDEHDQYHTTLSKNLWDPTAFSSWAFKEELAKSQQEVGKRKEEEKVRIQREAIDFVSVTSSLQSSSGGTPGTSGAVKGFRVSAAERVMAGLDREKTGSPQNPPMRDGSDRRGGRGEGSQQGMSSRSPKRRKRSRSR